MRMIIILFYIAGSSMEKGEVYKDNELPAYHNPTSQFVGYIKQVQ